MAYLPPLCLFLLRYCLLTLSSHLLKIKKHIMRYYLFWFWATFLRIWFDFTDWIFTLTIFILVEIAEGLGWAFISTRRSCWSIIVQFIQVFLYWAFSMLLVIICWNKWKYWLYVITSAILNDRWCNIDI